MRLHTDPATGRLFYVDPATGESRWVPPEAYQGAPWRPPGVALPTDDLSPSVRGRRDRRWPVIGLLSLLTIGGVSQAFDAPPDAGTVAAKTLSSAEPPRSLPPAAPPSAKRQQPRQATTALAVPAPTTATTRASTPKTTRRTTVAKTLPTRATRTSTTTATRSTSTRTTATTKAAASCDPNYTGACVPVASDVDCAGGSGNGPAYVKGPVTVIGDDVYGLDADDDGIGCE